MARFRACPDSIGVERDARGGVRAHLASRQREAAAADQGQRELREAATAFVALDPWFDHLTFRQELLAAA